MAAHHLVLPNVHRGARLEGNGDQLTGGVVGERDGPGTVRLSITTGSPARMPGPRHAERHGGDLTAGSCHSRVGCGKYTPFAGGRVTSAAGTSLPGIWPDDWPIWIRAMSAMGGISVQPDVVVRSGYVDGRTAVGHVVPAPDESVRHHGQVYGGGVGHRRSSVP